MDNSSDTQMLCLSVEDDHGGQNISFEDGTSLGTKRFHLDSESSEVGSLSSYMMDKRIKMENTSEDDASSGLIARNSCDDSAVELEDEGDMILGSTPEGISSAGGDMTYSPEDDNGDEDGCVLIHHMDIKEPLINLKKALEETHGISLDGYEFYLQDTTLETFFYYQDMVLTVQDLSECLCMCNQFPLPEDYPIQLAITSCNSTLLAGHKNLVEQCVQGCGTVQINLQLKIEDDGTKKINIIDVLKPSDSYLLATGNPAFSPDLPELPEEPNQPAAAEEEPEPEPEPVPEPSSDKNLIRWVVDHNFKANQQRLQIPQDPMEWLVPHVRHWLLWAVRQFNLTGIKLADWKINGATLCNLTLDDFKARVPYDPSDIFWTHLELLRRCKFVAVMQNPEEQVKQEIGELKPKACELDKNIMRGREKKAKAAQQVKSAVLMDANATLNQQTNWGNRTVSGNNGQVQLWQFLLDLLTDKDHRECIQWLGAEGEFKLIEPERVARLWGARKNKPSMNYEKLSRALRYYYDGDMIAKVHGKRFVYKFVCDLKQLLGYSAFELNRLVIEAEMRAQNANNDPIQHGIFSNREYSSLS